MAHGEGSEEAQAAEELRALMTELFREAASNATAAVGAAATAT